MSDREELSRRLVEENGLSDRSLRAADREALRAIVEAERRRGAHVRNAMLLSWAAFIVLFVGLVAAFFAGATFDARSIQVGRGTANVIALLALAALLLAFIAFIVAVVATVSWGLRMAFGPRAVGEQLARIEAQLARLQTSQADEGDGGAP